MFENMTLSEYAKVLASSSSVPGGGGASAVCGALGIALGGMVAEFTIGKKKYADFEDEAKELEERVHVLMDKFLEASEKDAVAFEPLSKAYSIPKDDPNRDEIMEKCLKDAAAVPLEIFDLCLEAIDILEIFGEKGSKLILSDAATGAVLVWGAMYGAAVNVKVNTKLMKDREYAEKINEHVDTMMDIYWKKAESTYENVYKTL